MLVESKIDHLIEAGWHVLLSDFDTSAFAVWRKEALECVTALMGPNHTYTKYFQDFVHGDDTRDVLSGEGILAAMREQIEGGGRRSGADEHARRLPERLLQIAPGGCHRGGCRTAEAEGSWCDSCPWQPCSVRPRLHTMSDFGAAT
jgi:hypothetical protein